MSLSRWFLFAQALAFEEVPVDLSLVNHFVEDDSLQLLQRAVHRHNSTFDPDWKWIPGHAITAAKSEGRMCSFGGDVHKANCHVPGGTCPGKDPMQLGLLKLTESADGRFKTQAFQCQVFFGPDLSALSMIGMDVAGTKIVIRNPTNSELDPDIGSKLCGQKIQMRINDEEYQMKDENCECPTCREPPASIPGTDIVLMRETHGIFIKHPEFWQWIRFQGWQYQTAYFAILDYTSWYKDLANVQQNNEELLCVHPEVVKPLNINGDWSGSLFSNKDHQQVCEHCSDNNLKIQQGHRLNGWNGHTPQQCDKPAPIPPPPPAQARCDANNCNWDHAQLVCSSLKGDEALSHWCLEDYCASCDEISAEAAIEEAEVIAEDPVCSANSPDCDPEETCSSSVRMNTLSLTQNNLGGVGPDTGAEEMRFGNAAVINGRAVDLVITTDGDFPTHKASRNGLNGKFGQINLKCKRSVKLDFQAVDTETGEPVNLDMVTISWYDIDEGKKGKGRSTVSTCGATGAITSSNSELTVRKLGGCPQVTSSTPGTAKDNPTDPFLLDPVQRARSVSFPMKNVKTFSSTLSVTKGFSGRNFMFAIEPSVACPPQF